MANDWGLRPPKSRVFLFRIGSRALKEHLGLEEPDMDNGFHIYNETEFF